MIYETLIRPVVIAVTKVAKEWVEKQAENFTLRTLYSHLIVPLIVISYAFLAMQKSDLGSAESALTVLPLSTQISSDGVAEKSGVALFVEPMAASFSLELSERGGEVSLWTSLDQESVKHNFSRVTTEQDRLEIRNSEILGPRKPFLVIAAGKTAEKILIGSRSMPIAELRPYSKSSWTTVLGGLAAAVFGLGLVAGRPFTEVNQERRCQESAKSDEDDVIQRNPGEP